MSERRLLAVLALLLAIVAGLMLMYANLRLYGGISLDWIFRLSIIIILGVVLIVAGLVAYERRYMEGGVLAIIVGLVAFFYTGDLVPCILALASGVLALAAERP